MILRRGTKVVVKVSKIPDKILNGWSNRKRKKNLNSFLHAQAVIFSQEFIILQSYYQDNPEETPNVEKAAVESVQSTNTESDVCQDLYAVARFDYAATKV